MLIMIVVIMKKKNYDYFSEKERLYYEDLHKQLNKLIRKVSKDPVLAHKFLKGAGIVDDDGNLTDYYKEKEL